MKAVFTLVSLFTCILTFSNENRLKEIEENLKGVDYGTPIKTPGLNKSGYPKTQNHLLDPKGHQTREQIVEEKENKIQEEIHLLRKKQEEELEEKLRKVFEENSKMLDAKENKDKQEKNK